MARKRIRQKGKKSNRKNQKNSSYASLCALSGLIQSRGIFECVHEKVKIPEAVKKWGDIVSKKTGGSLSRR